MPSSAAPKVEIRPLTPADADTCDAIIRSLPYHFGLEVGRQECARAVRTSDGLVAVHDGAVLGFLTVRRYFDASAEITWMAVHAGHRRRGIGHRLIERLCDELHSAGRRLLLVLTAAAGDDEVGVADSYQGTRDFYQSTGFIPAREFSELWPGNVALLMVRPLAPSGSASST